MSASEEQSLSKRPLRAGFPGVPGNLDAAFVWSGNGRIYFIKGLWPMVANSHAPTHTHSLVFRVKRRHCWLITKSSFGCQCIGRIRDTCSQLTWKSHSAHTHGSSFCFWPTLTPAQTLYYHHHISKMPCREVVLCFVCIVRQLIFETKIV